MVMPHHTCGGAGTTCGRRVLAFHHTVPNLHFQHRVNIHLHSSGLLSLLTAHVLNKSVHNLQYVVHFFNLMVILICRNIYFHSLICQSLLLLQDIILRKEKLPSTVQKIILFCLELLLLGL